jgi:general stress protein YciG
MAQDNKTGSSGTSNRGFASMDPALQREIASKGGRSVPPEERSFSKDRALAAEAGRKGGEASHGGRRAAGPQQPGGQPAGTGNAAGASNGGGNAAADRERASEIGPKGGSR